MQLKKQDFNARYGMSADFPFKCGDFQTVYRGSTSIFDQGQENTVTLNNSKEDITSLSPGRDSAGLGASNTIHKFLCVNGDKRRAKIFGNLLKNGVK